MTISGFALQHGRQVFVDIERVVKREIGRFLNLGRKAFAFFLVTPRDNNADITFRRKAARDMRAEIAVAAEDKHLFHAILSKTARQFLRKLRFFPAGRLV